MSHRDLLFGVVRFWITTLIFLDLEVPDKFIQLLKCQLIFEPSLELRQKLSEEMARVTVEGQEAVRPVPGPPCPDCQREMRYKGMKENTVSSWVGEVTFERGYFYCDHCRSGLFPPGPTT